MVEGLACFRVDISENQEIRGGFGCRGFLFYGASVQYLWYNAMREGVEGSGEVIYGSAFYSY